MPSETVVVFTSQDDPEISPNFWSRLRVQKKLLSKTEEQTAFCEVWLARRMPTGKGGHENNRRFLNGFFLTPKKKEKMETTQFS